MCLKTYNGHAQPAIYRNIQPFFKNGRDGIFKDNPVLARRAYEIISFETRLSTSIKELKAGNGTSNFMYLKKARAFTGKTTYLNWMRN